MIEIAEQTRRRRGRPQIRCDEDTRQLLIEAARHEFQANGYAGTCINDVAQRAGVSTKTMYRLIPNKGDLLERVFSVVIERFMIDFDAAALDALPLSEAIERMLIAYGSLTLREETIAMNRLVIRECGLIALEDPHVAAEMLRGMMIMDPQRAVMLGQRPAPSRAEIVARAKQCTRLFLRGCSAKPVFDKQSTG